MEKTVKWFAAAAGAVAGLFMRMPIAVRLLVLLMGLDYLSGVGVALLGKSPKSEGGALSSRAGFRCCLSLRQSQSRIFSPYSQRL